MAEENQKPKTDTIADNTPADQSTNKQDGQDTRNQEVESLRKQLEEKDKIINEWSPVVNFTAMNPKVRETFQKEWGDFYNRESSENQGEGNQETEEPSGDKVQNKVQNIEKEVTELSGTTRSGIINEFENDSGIANLPSEEKDKIRKSIAQKINSWGNTSIDKIELSRLKPLLKDAYDVVVGPEKMKENAAKVANNRAGAFGSMNSINVNTGEEDSYSPEQLDMLNKLGVDPKRAKEIEKKYVI